MDGQASVGLPKRSEAVTHARARRGAASVGRGNAVTHARSGACMRLHTLSEAVTHVRAARHCLCGAA